MLDNCKTAVRCAVGLTEEFKLEVGIHQGSALSHFLFALVAQMREDSFFPPMGYCVCT